MSASLSNLAQAITAFGPVRAAHLGEALRRCAEVERVWGGPRAETFSHQRIAYTLHGSGHAARVAAWSAWLALLPQISSTACRFLAGPPAHGVSGDAECEAAILAAFIHDTGRHNEWVDEFHGDASADHLGHHLRAAIADPRLAEDVVMAVRLHCRDAVGDESPYKGTRVWAMLRDADGLDWGRFGTPTSGYGCNVQYLRTSAASDMTVVWNAWHLAEMEPVGGWGDAPASRLRDTVRATLEPLANDDLAGPAVTALLNAAM